MLIRLFGQVVPALTLLLSASAVAESVSLIDDRGVDVRFDTAPVRIVSLLPSLTESVCALGACDRLVGTDRFSNWPSAVIELPKLGGFEDVQVERLYALRPDVVLVAESARVIARLESLGLKVVALEPRSLESAERAIRLLGTLLDVSDASEKLLEDIASSVADAAKRIPSRWRGAEAYFEVSSAPHAAGESSFIGELLATLGIQNIVPAELGPFPKLNPEFVIRAQPQLILGSSQAISGMGSRPGWGRLEALKKGHVCRFEPPKHDVLVRPGPRLGEAAGILADCLSALPIPDPSPE